MKMRTFGRFAVVLFALACCLQAGAADIKLKQKQAVVNGINFALNGKKQIANVTKNKEPYVGDIVIPEKIEVDGVTLYVEEIESGAFKDCSGVTSISIPNCILKIGSSAFEGCSSLAAITGSASD